MEAFIIIEFTLATTAAVIAILKEIKDLIPKDIKKKFRITLRRRLFGKNIDKNIILYETDMIKNDKIFRTSSITFRQMPNNKVERRRYSQEIPIPKLSDSQIQIYQPVPLYYNLRQKQGVSSNLVPWVDQVISLIYDEERDDGDGHNLRKTLCIK